MDKKISEFILASEKREVAVAVELKTDDQNDVCLRVDGRLFGWFTTRGGPPRFCIGKYVAEDMGIAIREV